MHLAGEVVEIEPEADARDLIALGFASNHEIPALEQKTPTVEHYQRRDMRAVKE